MKKNEKKIYLDPKQPVEKRVNDLLKRMTIEEKVCQLGALCTDDVNIGGRFSLEKLREHIDKNGIGHLAGVLSGFDAKESAENANRIWKFIAENTRLGIPVLIHDECLHGCVAKNCTGFPQAIALASMWDTELFERIVTAIGREARSRGIFHALSPTINIARDSRCGRVQETYGEDPYLAKRMAVTFVKALQGQKVVATPKHYAGNFTGDGGRDSFPVHFTERLMREIYFPAFEAVVKEAGALSIMAAYNSYDGIPCSCSRWLLTDVLRKDWGFKGFVVSDYDSIAYMHTRHKVAETKAIAAKKAIEAGLDVEFRKLDYYKELIRLAKSKKVSIKTLDEAVKRVLRVKFWAGLFDNPVLSPEDAGKINKCREHVELALEASRKSIVLLKNDGLLPLKKDLKTIAVMGPNADKVRLGGYSTWYTENAVSPLEGLKRKTAGRTEILFEKGCDTKILSKEGFAQAMDTAKKSDAVIIFAGNVSGVSWLSPENSEGEEEDRSNLNLPGVQEELIIEISRLGKPVVVVLIGGSAVTMESWMNKVNAIVEAWYPGEQGGNAIADVLFGDYNPGGKLPITFPKTTGQLPLYHSSKPSGRVYDYVDLRGQQERFPFGFGLSYTKFEYGNLSINKTGKNIKINVEVRNAGGMTGDEVVLLFLRDDYSSLARPLKELKGFKRINLKPDEKQVVEFTLERKDLAFLDEELKPVVEPGTFTVMVGTQTGSFRI